MKFSREKNDLTRSQGFVLDLPATLLCRPAKGGKEGVDVVTGFRGYFITIPPDLLQNFVVREERVRFNCLFLHNHSLRVRWDCKS